MFPLPLSEKVAAGLGCQMDSAQAGTDVCVPLAWVDWYIYTDVCVYILYVLGVKMSEGVEVREQRSLIFQMFKKYKSSSVYIHRLLGCQ